MAAHADASDAQDTLGCVPHLSLATFVFGGRSREVIVQHDGSLVLLPVQLARAR